jgi:hypothetical protein
MKHENSLLCPYQGIVSFLNLTTMHKLTGAITILLLTFFGSCGKLPDTKGVSAVNQTERNRTGNDTFNIEQRHYLDTTLTVNHKSYRLFIQDINEDEITLTFFRDNKMLKVDTLLSGGLGNIEFIDLDNDNNKDILISYIGNNAVYDLYMFDKLNNEFKFLYGFNRFPEAIQLTTNKKYYFSYRRAGCADMNWVSDLFYIDDFKTIHIGHIYGQGCDYEVKENPQVIEIYKVTDNDLSKKIIAEKLPYKKNIPDFGDKWTFIEKYWNKNYKKYN